MSQIDIIEQTVPATGKINAEQLLNNIEKFLDDHAILPKGASTALALWFFSTYAINSFSIFPKITIYSPEKRCGKSTLLDLIEAFSCRSLIVSNITPAAIYRFIDMCQPTLIIDEADTFIKNGNSEMVGIINSGHAKRRAQIIRASGESFEPEVFSTWTPMVLASIGKLQSTIMDRSIVIKLERKMQTDTIQAIPPNLFEACEKERGEILKWCNDHKSAIENNIMRPPSLGNDRAVDNWSPLFTIANLVSKQWVSKCEAAFKNLYQVDDEPANSTLLLSDIRAILQNYPKSKIASEVLLKKLIDIEDQPWCEYKGGRPITKNGIANLLKIYGIKPKSIRVGSNTLRGYEQAQFKLAFQRYLT